MSGNSGPFDLGKMAFGGLGQMFDGIDSVKRAWSMFNAPSALVPTLDVDELDKRIADLKAVEQWLNLNVSMLHGTIQGLEIQRGTLAAVKAFGSSFSAAMPGSATRAATGAPPAGTPADWPRPSPATPFATASTAHAAPPEQARSRARSSAPRAATEEASAPQPRKAASAAQSGAAPGIDAGAWWNLLQGTFNQVAQAALSGAGLPGLAQAAAPAAKRGTSGSSKGGARTGTGTKTASRSGAKAAPTRSRG